MNSLIPALVVLVNWTLPSFLDKKTLDIISPRDLTLNRWVLGGAVALAVLLALGDRYDFKNNKKTFATTFALVLLSITASFMYYTLLKSNDASTLMIVLNPINILAAALVGWYFFGEKFNREMWLGVLAIVGGLLLFLKGKGELK